MKNGFLTAFRGDALEQSNTAIPFRQDLTASHDILQYLRSTWLGRDHVHVSDKLASRICGQVWEIVINAFQHGNSSVGITTCGQFHPVGKRLTLTIVDWGIGIPATIRDHFASGVIHAWSAEECMAWAFDEPGNTTAIGPVSRGLGLKLLKDFVKLSGTMEVFSHEGYSRISSGHQEMHKTVPMTFPGTMVTLDLACDERRFVLSSEIDRDKIF